MKILVFAHQLVMGGSTVNAIDLAAAMRDHHGCDVTLFASPGRMEKLVQDQGLKYLPAPPANIHPTLAIMRALRRVVRAERPDVIHAWEWWQALDAFFSVHLPTGAPLVVSDMSMNVTRLLPKNVVTTWGTPELVDRARSGGRPLARLLLPPVDTIRNAPGAVNSFEFRTRLGLRDDEIVLVTVSRLASFLKGESLRQTIKAVAVLGSSLPVRFVVAGDGDARSDLERLADSVNHRLGRPAVLFTGMLIDPREAYDAADIVLGMGSSALRGMAFAKPVIVVGERGFSAPFDQDTADAFYYKGMYGIGDGRADPARLAEQIATLVRTRDSHLGTFARAFVEQHFSLQAVARQLVTIYREAFQQSVSSRGLIADGLRTTAIYLRERRFLSRSRSPDPNA